MLSKSHQASSLNGAFTVLLTIVFLLPIPLGANRPWAWSFFELTIFALGFYVAFRQKRRMSTVLKKYFASITLFLAFICIALLQLIPLPSAILGLISPSSAEVYLSIGANLSYISVDVGQTTITFIKTLSFFVLFVLILQLVNTEKRIKSLLTVMLASGTFQALYGAFEVLLGVETSIIHQLEVTDIATGSFVYKNHYANFLMLCLCAGLGLIVTALEKEKHSSPRDFLRGFAKTMLSSKAIIRICLAVMVIALVMSRSRMGNTAFFAAMAITGLIALVLIRNRSQGLSILVISMFVIDLFIVSAYFGLEQVQQRLTQTSLEQESRDEVVRDAFAIVKDYPAFGSGGGSFYSIFPGYQQANVSGFYDHAHNDYLQFVIEYGFIGALIIGSLFAFAFYKSLRAMNKRKNSIFKGTGFACAMAFIGMGIHITVDFPLQAYANAAYFVIFIALAMVINSTKLSARGVSSRT